MSDCATQQFQHQAAKKNVRGRPHRKKRKQVYRHERPTAAEAAETKYQANLLKEGVLAGALSFDNILDLEKARLEKITLTSFLMYSQF
jgi:hypothetical protein